MSFEIGTILEGTVSSITKFGAFITLPGGGSGMVHISEIASAYVKDVADYVKPGELIKVKVIAVDERGRIGLSIKALEPAKPAPAPAKADEGGQFEDMLSKFMKTSSDRINDLKRGEQPTRGRRGTRK